MKSMKNTSPDFNYLVKVLKREKTDRPVLFEFIIDPDLCRKYATKHAGAEEGSFEFHLMLASGFKNLGYDYAPVYPWFTDFLNFPKTDFHSKASRSQNEGGLITDRGSYEKYPWPDAENADYSLLDKIGSHVDDGQKLLACSNGGVLENATDLIGFENLCMMYLTDPELTREIFDSIGSRLLRYYEIVSSFESVGVCMVNDDWGFKNQTMFPPEMMREYVFPWTKKAIESIHKNKKPAILHSCGNLKDLMPEIISDLKIDAKHSFEDTIYTIEDAYEWWHESIALVGGIDMDYLCRASKEEVYDRATKLLKQTFDRGGYALGSGNSIPHYVPEENFLALSESANNFL